MPTLRRLAWLPAMVLLAACSSSTSTSSPLSIAPSAAAAATADASSTATPTPTATTVATPVQTPAGPSRSRLYGFSLTSADWIDYPATVAWDGTGAPGDGDPFVDILQGPNNARAWAYGEPTTATLADFVDDSRTTNAGVHSCPAKPKSTTKSTIDGSPAIVDVHDCGVIALTAYVVRDGRAVVFFTYGQPETQAVMRTGFDALLKVVSLD